MTKKNGKDGFNLRTNRNVNKSSSGLSAGFFASPKENTEPLSQDTHAPSNYKNSIVNHLVNVSTGLDAVLVDIDNLYSAPEDWNFYDRLPPDKMQELIESIINLGLQEPVIAWKRDNSGKYMILSGHNRVHAYRILRDNQDKDKYSKIHAVIKDSSLTEEEAKEIIVDTNWVQRQLTTIQKAKSISFKYSKLKNDALNKHIKFDINSVIANDYNITSRQIISYKSLENLSAAAQKAVDENHLSIKAGVAVSKLNYEDQQYLLENYDFPVINKKYSLLKKACDEKTGKLIRSRFKEIIKDNDYETITIKIPANLNHKKDFLLELEELKNKYLNSAAEE